ELKIGAIELHHFLDYPGVLIDDLIRLGLPYDAYVHDYIWICPRITLIDADGRFCGEPETSVCDACVAKPGVRHDEGLAVGDLRDRSRRWLSGARRRFAPTRDVAARMERHFPGLDFSIGPWEAPPSEAPPLPPS